MPTLNDYKSGVSYAILGEYLRGARNKSFPKDTLSKDIGIAVLGESYDFSKPLVDTKRFDNPAVSLGTVSSLIDTLKNQIDDVYVRAEGVFGPNRLHDKEAYMERYIDKLMDTALPIAFSEGADDDELKMDISVLLRQSKEEFEKRIERNEKEKQEEKDGALADDTFDSEEPQEGTEEAPEEGEEGVVENPTPFGSDDSDMADGDEEIPEGFEEEAEETDSDDGWDSEEEEESEDSEEAEDEEENTEEAKGESMSLRDDFLAFLDDRNGKVPYAEEMRFLVNGRFSAISESEFKSLSNKLLEIEEANFKAIGENFNFSDIKPDSRLQQAHASFVEANACVLIMKKRLNII